MGDLAGGVAGAVCGPVTADGPAVYHAAHCRPVRMDRVLGALHRRLGLPVPWDVSPREHRALVADAVPELSDHQYALLTQDHWYRSDRLWTRVGEDPGIGLGGTFRRGRGLVRTPSRRTGPAARAGGSLTAAAVMRSAQWDRAPRAAGTGSLPHAPRPAEDVGGPGRESDPRRGPAPVCRRTPHPGHCRGEEGPGMKGDCGTRARSSARSYSARWGVP